MMYSSGIYNDPGDDLTATQYRKNDRALSRLTDKEGILEIDAGGAVLPNVRPIKGATLQELPFQKHSAAMQMRV